MGIHLNVSLSISLTHGTTHGALVNELRRPSFMAIQFQKRNLVVCPPDFQRSLAGLMWRFVRKNYMTIDERSYNHSNK